MKSESNSRGCALLQSLQSTIIKVTMLKHRTFLVKTVDRLSNPQRLEGFVLLVFPLKVSLYLLSWFLNKSSYKQLLLGIIQVSVLTLELLHFRVFLFFSKCLLPNWIWVIWRNS